VPRDVWDEALHEKRGEDRAQNTVGRILQARSQNPYFRPQDFDRPSSIQADILREHVLPMVASRPVEARCKTIVLADADQVTRDMGNILLKTLEEPPADCLLVLTTSVPQRLLPTIRSRCQSLRFAPLDPEWMQPRLQTLLEVPPVKAKLAAAVSQGSMLTAQRFVEGDLEEVRDHAFGVFEAAAGGEELELLEIAQLLHHEHPKRRHLVPLMLQMLAVVARDAILVAPGLEVQRGGADLPRLANADRQAAIEHIARSYPAASLPNVIRRVEAAERQIAGNALVEHALAALFLDIAALASPQEKVGGRR
jgi:DNA polymerase-3 subunit delta'